MSEGNGHWLVLPGLGLGPLGPPSPGLCAPAHHYFAWCFLQIMIEFCPGGAVDAIMLGECLWTQGNAARSALSGTGVLHSPTARITLTYLSTSPLCPLLGAGVGFLGRTQATRWESRNTPC